jgi:hypothetical protein
MRSSVLLLLTAALPAILTANSIYIGLSTNPVDFTATTSTTGVIKVGTCSPDCDLEGEDASNIPLLNWSLESDGALAYTYSGTPDLYDLTGDPTSFLLTDAHGDSIPGTITWNTATVEGLVPTVSHRFTRAVVSDALTDLNGTLTLGTVDFVSNTDPLAEEVIAAFGSLPVTGERGSVDFFVNCSEPCIAAPTAADVLETSSRFHQHSLGDDPSGPIQSAEITLNGNTTVPEPGMIFVLPAMLLVGLILGGLILRKRQRSKNYL